MTALLTRAFDVCGELPTGGQLSHQLLLGRIHMQMHNGSSRALTWA